MAFCKNCGKQLNDRAKFCGGCGTKVSRPQFAATTKPKKTAGIAPERSEKEKRARKVKIAVSLIVLVILSVSLWLVYEAGDFATRWYRKNRGAMTFTISTAEELAGLASIVNGTWKDKPERDNFAGKTITLAGNIDLSAYDNWVPIGDYTTDSNNVFSGTFDGSGNVIKGLIINRYEDRQGLFGRIDGGNVQNLGFDGVDIKGRNRVGVVAGVVNKGSSITNCYSAGTISGASIIGGIAGSVANNSSIVGSYSTAAISGDAAIGGVAGGVNMNSSIANSYSTGTVKGDEGVGGVAGSVLDSSKVINSYSIGTVSGNDEVGGVAGQILSKSSLINSYFTGSISGRNRVGGMVGGVYKNSQVANSYSSGTINGNEGVGGVVGGIYESQVINSYSIGAVSGSDVVGGVVGGVRASTVANCAALNPEVKGSGNVGRVFSNAWNSSKLLNNVAYSEMTNNAGNSKWANIGENKRDGISITIAAIKADSTIGGRFIIANGWSVQNGNLPGIGGTVTIPLHLRAKTEADCTVDEVWENSACRAKTEEEICTEAGDVWVNNACRAKTEVIQAEQANQVTNIVVDGQEEQDDE